MLLSAVGFVVLSRLSGDSDRGAGLLGWVATALIAGGGLSKNILKSMQAVTGGAFESAVLENALFWLLAPGFLVAMAAFARAVRSDAGLAPRWPWATVWAVGAVVAAAVLATEVPGRAWFFWLLAAATVANALVVVVLVRWSRLRSDRPAGALFVVSLVIVIGLSGAAAALPQTIPVQWLQQTGAAGAQGCFMWGAIRLARTPVA